MPCYYPDVVLMDHSPELHGEKAKCLKFIRGCNNEFPGYEFYEKQNKTFQNIGSLYEFIKIPCGDCVGCQEAYSKEWATRMTLEAEKWPSNYFLTLTYDDYHIPIQDELCNKKTGEIFENDNWMQGTVLKEDCQKFLKDLRRQWEYHYKHQGIRFYLSSEYGPSTNRPHYHMILFNFPIPVEELEIRKVDRDGNIHWTHKRLEKIWGKGFIDLCEVNWDTCAYVARYVMKKMKGKKPDEWYYEQGMAPEFNLMSRMPGIGMDFFSKNFQKIYQRDEIILKGHREKIQPVKPPKYYDRKFDLINPEEMKKIKEKRKMIAASQCELKNMQTSLTEKERLQVEEKTKRAKWKTLKRDKI